MFLQRSTKHFSPFGMASPRLVFFVNDENFCSMSQKKAGMAEIYGGLDSDFACGRRLINPQKPLIATKQKLRKRIHFHGESFVLRQASQDPLKSKISGLSHQAGMVG